MHSVPRDCSPNTGRPLSHRRSRYGLAGVMLALGVLGGVTLLAVQVPSAPTNVRLLLDGAAQPTPFVGTTIYVSTSGLDTNAGTLTSPVRTIQKGVLLANQANKAGNNALVSIGAGTYREIVDISSLSTTNSLTLQGAGENTILSGADDWSTGWAANPDGTYVHSWSYKWGAQGLPSGWSDYWNWDGKGYLRNRILRYEMVYINDRGLLGRLNLSELSTAGTFYVDETNSKIYLRPFASTTMSTARIEVAVR